MLKQRLCNTATNVSLGGTRIALLFPRGIYIQFLHEFGRCNTRVPDLNKV